MVTLVYNRQLHEGDHSRGSMQVRTVSCDPSGQWLLTGSDDGTVRLWHVPSGHCRRVWDLGRKAVS